MVRDERRPRIGLGGAWSLRLDPRDRGAREGWAQGRESFEHVIAVPGCVNALPVFAGQFPSVSMPNSYEGTCWYRRLFEIPEDWRAERTWLLFGGIMPSAHIWLNGRYLGSHSQSPVSVKFDASAAVQPGTSNVLTVELPWRDLGLRGGLKFGPGIWRTVEMEGTAASHLENIAIRPMPGEQRVVVTVDVHNDARDGFKGVLQARVVPWRAGGPGFEAGSAAFEVPPGGERTQTLTIEMPEAMRWSPDKPFLYVLTLSLRQDGQTVDALAERFGMRQLTVGPRCLLLNGEPFMFRAVCDEFFGCPTISPIVDPALIRQRLMALKTLGFNGKRYHTHLPAREEMDACDELGLMVHAEISVISNFNNTEPYPENRETWKAGLKALRNHASFCIYCMGNEGSQIMDGLYDRVKEYYADARGLAPDLPILAASGMQGEHPEVPNDFETPHFWARFFVWSYDGLSAVPWAALAPLSAKKPLLIHEYGKFTIWPDPAEDKLFREFGAPLRGNYGAMGLLALEEAGMTGLLPRILHNSRALAAVCNKIAIEEARRTPRVSGYHLLSAFRLNGNRGMVDEFGRQIDPQAHEFVNSNGPSALVIDRGYRGRAFASGQRVKIQLHLSHFGDGDLLRGSVHWRVLQGVKTVSEGTSSGHARFPRGENGPLCEIAFTAPDLTGKLRLEARLLDGRTTVAGNSWDFWSFEIPDGIIPDGMVCDGRDAHWELDLMGAFPEMRRLDDHVSIWRGDRIAHPSGRETADYLSACPPATVVADHWSGDLPAYVEGGGTVLLFDNGRFPEAWYAPRLASDKAYGAEIAYDMFTMFSPFRAGWDHGNAATLFEDHSVLSGFPQDGYCDLQCFCMVQGARALRVAALPGSVKPILRVIPIWQRRGAQSGPSPQNPDIPRAYATEARVYLAECTLGKGRLLVSSLRHFADPAGRWLLNRLVAGFTGS